MPTQTKDWQAPTFETLDKNKLGWVKEAIDDGTKWTKRQCSEKDIERGIDILSARGGDKKSLAWSDIHTGDLSSTIRDIIETLANIRLSFAGFQTSNRAFLDHADMMNKVVQHIYTKYFVDRSLRDALQYAALTGGGFISPYVDRKMYGTGKMQFMFEALSQMEVLPVQLPKDRNYQDAYVVTIARMMGVAKAHALFPAYQAALVPFARKKLRGGQADRLDARRTSSRWQQHSTDELLEQYCEVFYTYILDLRTNDTPIGQESRVLPMGQKDTSWFYEVPYVSQEIQRWEDGRMVTRAATDDDCRIYPQRRLMISCDAALMYDGPAFDMHGMVPLVSFYLNDWAWEGTGYSLFSQTAPLQENIDMLERGCNRIAKARLDPGKSYNADVMDKGARLSSRQAETIDPFSPSLTCSVDGDIKDPVMRPMLPEWCYLVPEFVPSTIERQRESIKRVLGFDQIQSLQKLRANIQSPEKLLDAEGPVVIGTSRSMERGLRELGTMTGYNVLQYMPTGVVVMLVGAEQVPHEVFDYNPDSIIPSHLPGETTINAEGATVASAFDRFRRARYFADAIEYEVVPHSLHEIAQNQERLNMLALAGKGPQIFPVDPETLGNKFNIKWGSLDGATIKEKYKSFLKEQVEFKAEMAKLEQGLGIEPPAPPPGKSSGRPPTNAKNPQAKQKGTASGGRVVMSTSG
jgi:hypothetical protein